MRYSYALITGLALTLLPSISHAAPSPVASSATAEVRTTAATRPSASAVKPAQAQAQTSQTTKEDKSRYAKREAASPEAQAYRGGDTIVIGASAAVAILAVILILVLI